MSTWNTTCFVDEESAKEKVDASAYERYTLKKSTEVPVPPDLAGPGSSPSGHEVAGQESTRHVLCVGNLWGGVSRYTQEHPECLNPDSLYSKDRIVCRYLFDIFSLLSAVF